MNESSLQKLETSYMLLERSENNSREKKKGRTLGREDPESRGVWAEERLKEGGRPQEPTTGPGGSFPGSVVWLRW